MLYVQLITSVTSGMKLSCKVQHCMSQCQWNVHVKKKIKSINVFILDCIIQCKCNLDPYKLSLFDRKWLVC